MKALTWNPMGQSVGYGEKNQIAKHAGFRYTVTWRQGINKFRASINGRTQLGESETIDEAKALCEAHASKA